MIEFDENQHFAPVKYFGGQDAFERTQRNDAIKNEYCITNNIHLLRIKYTDFEKISELISSFLKMCTYTSATQTESQELTNVT